MNRTRTIRSLVVPPLGGRSVPVRNRRVVAGLPTEPHGVTAGLRSLRETYGQRSRRGQETRAEHGTRAEHRTRAEHGRTGFTLIEMLVAVTLVLLMMVMFGEMFQLASGSVTKQRVMADNDQNARTFVTVIRADLDKRSFRTLVPFFARESPNDPGTPFTARRGYFYISNNNNGYNPIGMPATPADGTDDVLQFTVLSTVKNRNADESPYVGRAVQLPGSFYTNLNQPDWDDGQADPSDLAGASQAAEVCYFMRGSRLYRRVMLLRTPIIPNSSVQPADNTGTEYPVGSYPLFWQNFDYSAHRMSASLATVLATAASARFNGINSKDTDFLSNAKPLTHILPSPPFAANSYHPYAYSMGQTWNRFGFNHEIAGPGVLALPAAPYSSLQNGLPREFGTNSASPPAGALGFFGRFTHEETSHAAFIYPQGSSTAMANGNPMDGDTASTAGNTLSDANFDGVIDQYAGGPRVGVDLLLSHVHEFRVEVWDQRLNNFAPIGHTLPTGGNAYTNGDYNISRRLNSTFGPLVPPGGPANVFDTWHPEFNRNFNFDAGGNVLLGDEPDRPPYRPLNYDPTGLSGSPPPGPSPPAPFIASYWAPNTTYNIGDVVFPRTEDLNADGLFNAATEDGVCGFPANSLPDAKGPFPAPSPTKFPAFGLTYAYRCIRSGHTLGTGVPGTVFEPTWSATTGYIIHGRKEDPNYNGVFDAGESDVDGDGVPENEPDWVVDYNVRPLRAIRITVRFEHPSSKQMKQVTIVHSLRDTTSVP